jgi:hypothetical protein
VNLLELNREDSFIELSACGEGGGSFLGMFVSDDLIWDDGWDGTE